MVFRFSRNSLRSLRQTLRDLRSDLIQAVDIRGESVPRSLHLRAAVELLDHFELIHGVIIREHFLVVFLAFSLRRAVLLYMVENVFAARLATIAQLHRMVLREIVPRNHNVVMELELFQTEEVEDFATSVHVKVFSENASRQEDHSLEIIHKEVAVICQDKGILLGTVACDITGG